MFTHEHNDMMYEKPPTEEQKKDFTGNRFWREIKNIFKGKNITNRCHDKRYRDIAFYWDDNSKLWFREKNW